jgi:hypothetical protein
MIVREMDRLTRNLWDTARLSDLMSKGKQFIAVVGGAYTNDARGQFRIEGGWGGEAGVRLATTGDLYLPLAVV